MRTFSLSLAGMDAVLSALARPAQSLEVFREKVRPIIAAVRAEGDDAVRRFTMQFDSVLCDTIRVPQTDITDALTRISPELRSSMERAKENIVRFHKSDSSSDAPMKSESGVVCWREQRSIPSVGLYIPGGTAPLFSTVLMLGIPAQIAGVPRIVLCSPPQKNGTIADPILAACALLGITEVYAVGGAQAIAALAYGTQTIKKVDKIAGPGNAYVSAAKAEVSADPDGAAIDMLAGPSELLVIADAEANASFVAADLLSQAEHDVLSQVILLTTSADLLAAVERELARQLETLPRKEIAVAALEKSVGIVTQTLDEAVQLSNAYAPEHLSLQVEKPEKLLTEITNAGSIFLGAFSPETVGDYCSGTNHVLPTCGTARVQGGVSVRTFQKTMTVQRLFKDALQSLRSTATTLARAEGMEAHARAVDIRFPSAS